VIRLLFIPFIFLFSINAWSNDCGKLVTNYLPNLVGNADALRTECVLLGGHQKTAKTYQEIMESCKSWNKIKDAMDECNAYTDLKNTCEGQNDEWSYHGDTKSWRGTCNEGCAEGTQKSYEETHGSHGTTALRCICPSDSETEKISPGESIVACGLDRDEDLDCSIYIDMGEYTQEYYKCIENNRTNRENQAQINSNINSATSNMSYIAQRRLDASLQAATKILSKKCEDHAGLIYKNCNKDIPKGFYQSLNSLGTLNKDSSFDQCTNNKGVSLDVNKKSNALSNTCNGLYKNLDSMCPATTGVLQETASNNVDGQTVSDIKAGVADIYQNQLTKNNAQMVFHSSHNLFLECIELSSKEFKSAATCLIAFNEDLAPQNKEISIHSPLQTENFAEKSYDSNERYSSEAYKSGRATFEALNLNQRSTNNGRRSSANSYDNELAYDPGFEDTSNNYRRPSRELSSSNISNTQDLGFESSNELSRSLNRTNQKDSVSNSFNNTQVNIINRNKALKSLGPVERFAVTKNNGIDLTTKKRLIGGNFKDSDQRNLLLGYKKIKNSNGQDLTIHPDDYKKFGKKRLSALAKKANTTLFKKGYPMIFDGHSFMPDFIEYKKTKTAKYYWNKMKDKFYRVDKEKVKKNAFHPCVERYECYINSEYNIFRLHHLKYQKLKSKGYFKID
jgi:hypothetical protein